MTRLPTVPGSFSDIEEEFFRAGTALGQAEPVETFDDLDTGYERPGLWRRLFSRKSSRR